METKKERPEIMKGHTLRGEFIVPDNYFDELPGRIRSRITAKKPEQHAGALYLFWRFPQATVAAAFVVLVVAGYFSARILTDKPGNRVITGHEVAGFVEFYNADFDEVEIIEALIPPLPVGDNEINHQEDIIEYLVEENIDIETIIEEL